MLLIIQCVIITTLLLYHQRVNAYENSRISTVNATQCKVDHHLFAVDDDENDYEEDYSNNESQQKTKLVVTHSFAKCHGITSALNINLFPSQNHYNLQSIEFQQSNLSVVPNGMFDAFSNLTKLNMSSSFVTTIQSDAFSGLISLQDLYLDNNDIVEVPTGTFRSLSILKTLDLQSNSIGEIEEGAFAGLKRLKYLYLNNNNLRSLLPTTFEQMEVLTHINISYNFLQRFEVKSIRLVTQFDVSFNLLRTFNLSIFSTLITQLRLESNQISEVTPMKEDGMYLLYLNHNNLSTIPDVASTLTYLDLNENKIMYLNSSMFSRAKELETLHLSHNHIANLTVEMSNALTSLRHLHLGHNYISFISVGYFRNLRELRVLDLSNNQLSEIDYGTFTGLSELTHLDLSNNKFSHLYESSLYRLSSLTDLNLESNHLTTISPRDLRRYLLVLRNIQLEGNDWTCKFLSELVTEFHDIGVSVLSGGTETASNFHGIACKRFENVLKNVTDFNTQTAASIGTTDRATTLNGKEFNQFWNIALFNGITSALSEMERNSNFSKISPQNTSNSEFYRMIYKILKSEIASRLNTFGNISNFEFNNGRLNSNNSEHHGTIISTDISPPSNCEKSENTSEEVGNIQLMIVILIVLIAILILLVLMFYVQIKFTTMFQHRSTIKDDKGSHLELM